MFDKRILRLTPKRIYCPICGEWHDWEGKSLQSYDEDNPYEYDCAGTTLCLSVHDDYIEISSDGICCYEKISDFDDLRIYFDDIEVDDNKPVIKLAAFVSTDEIVSSRECKKCNGCFLHFIGDRRSYKDDEFTLKLEFKFEFASSSFGKYAKEMKVGNIQPNHTPQSSKTTTSEANKTTTKNVKEETSMANNNIFNMPTEFGPNKDENIASTLMGIAVKTDAGSWRIFDKKKKEITDVGDMQLGNLPIFNLPAIKLSEGDLINDNNDYYYVIKVEPGSTQTISATTGEMKTVIPIKNILGFSFYTKVIALTDSFNIGEDLGIEKAVLMSAMFGQSGKDGNQMNQLLPLLLLKEDFAEGDDTTKLVLMSSMMNPSGDGNQLNQFFPLLLLKDKEGGNDDLMKLMLMSSMMGNAESANNPMMAYLMLDKFIGSKKDNEVKKDDKKS